MRMMKLKRARSSSRFWDLTLKHNEPNSTYIYRKTLTAKQEQFKSNTIEVNVRPITVRNQTVTSIIW